MNNDILELSGVRFLSLSKISKKEQRHIDKLPYNCGVYRNHGFFIKVMDYKFRSMNSRAGYAMVHLDDLEKYHSFTGSFEDWWVMHLNSEITE